MVEMPFGGETVWDGVAAPAKQRADAWIDAIRASSPKRASGLLGGMQHDPESFEYTRRLVELVAGTEDAFTSAMGLREMAHEVPGSMPVGDRIAMRAGGVASLGLPWAVMPVARRWLRDRMSHLVLAAKLPPSGSAGGLTEALRRHTDAGLATVIEPLGEAVHGPAGAAAELARLVALAGHPAVAHLIVDPARLVPGGSDWSADSDAPRLAEKLRPLLEASVEHGTVIHLRARSVRWARLVPEALIRALADPALDRARVGVRLLSELPESREQYSDLSRWALRRVADGGAPAEVTIEVGGVAAAERTASIVSGLPVPVIEDPVELRAQELRLIELALHPRRAAALRPVIASEDPLTLAATLELARIEGSTGLVAVQLRSGVAQGLTDELIDEVPEVRTALPVISPKEFAGAIDVIVGYAAEAADPASTIARFEQALAVDNPEAQAAWEGVLGEFDRAVELAAETAPRSHRTQLRAREWDPTERDSALFYRAPDDPAAGATAGLTAAVLGLTRGETGELHVGEIAPARVIPVVSESGLANEPATDASIAANRDWVRDLLARAVEMSRRGDRLNDTVALSPADLDPEAAAEAAREAGAQWAAQPTRIRAVRLRRTALAVVAARDRMLHTLAADTGAPAAELDAEINTVVDAARYCAQLAEGLQAVRGAEFVPDGLALVVADEWTSFSAQVGTVLAALAAGSGVLWAVPQRLMRSAVALLEEWEVGGLTPGAVRLEAVAVGETTLPALAASPSIDRVVVLGSRRTARELARYRPELRLEGRFRGRGSMLVTATADIDQAIDDLVESAFRGSGTDPRTINCAVLLGGAAKSRRFRDGLADAVRALRVGDSARADGGVHAGDGVRAGDAAREWAGGDPERDDSSTDPLSFDLGPLPAPPTPEGLRTLTELGRGESWLVQPRQLDEAGLLWTPGVRLGVASSSTFWDDAIGLPVLGIATVQTFGEAVRLQNAPGSGVIAAVQSNDPEEVGDWLASVEAASLVVNTATTGARVERQPSGAWNAAALGLPALSGGPNWLVTLGSWRLREGTRSETLHLRGLDSEVRHLIERSQQGLSYEEFDELRRAALSDALAWRTSFGVMRDTVGLGVERDVMRYWPVQTQVRWSERAPLVSLLRVLAAALLVRARITVSVGDVLPDTISDLLEKYGIEVSLERDDDWLERLAAAEAKRSAGARPSAAGTGPRGGDAPEEAVGGARIRLIGGDRVRVAEWLGGPDRAALWAEPVTMAGPVELLTMLREQSITARAHRRGLAIPVPGLDSPVGE